MIENLKACKPTNTSKPHTHTHIPEKAKHNKKSENDVFG